MTIITIKVNKRTKAGKELMAMVESYKDKEGIEMNVSDSSDIIDKSALIRRLAKASNRNMTKKLYASHNLPYPENDSNH